MISALPPVLVSVTVCAVLVAPTVVPVKVSVVVERLATGAATPVPVNSTTWGLPGALSVIVRAPTLGPGDVGVNATLITQLVEGWRGAAVQSLVSENAPLVLIAVIVNALVALFVTVTGWELLATATC